MHIRARRGVVGSGALQAVPAWFYYVFFFIAPVGLIVWYSFGEKPNLIETHSNAHLSLARYADVLQGNLLDSFVRTSVIAVIAVAVCLIIGYPFAYWMSTRLSTKWRYIVLVLVMIPFWTNFLVRTIGWQLLLETNGWLSSLIAALGGERLHVLGTTFAVELGVVYNYLPLMILPLFVTLDKMDHALRESSKDLGANSIRTFVNVTLPQSLPGVTAGMLLVYVPLMGDYVTATVLGGSRGTMVGQYVASDFLQAQDWATGSAAAVVLVLTILITVLLASAVGRIAGAVIARFYRLELPTISRKTVSDREALVQ